MAAEGRYLQLCAEGLKHAVLTEKDDVHPARFVEGAKKFTKLLEGLGPFVEAGKNVTKVDGSMEKLEEWDSMRRLLQLERDSGMHGKGSDLKDPSAAIGLVWICRFLALWNEICMVRIQPDPTDGTARETLKQTIEGAFKRNLLPYTGWVSQKSFEVGLTALPAWDDIRKKLAPPDDAIFEEDVFMFMDSSQVHRGYCWVHRT